ncbi:HU family DNA-binding protein [Bernardetia sp.]|uniref:HU family DNA-binding protein n=1 Tax=Bernardetia sp. TaxID=1937974 RepID=UPI0025C198EB|nr:HU family DNA-binding protein [Bernardetia sp.]
MKHKEFVKEYAQKMNCDEETAKEQITTFTDIILESMKKNESVTIEHFGRFYIRERTNSKIFKFLPANKFKAILGWANDYKGKI